MGGVRGRGRRAGAGPARARRGRRRPGGHLGAELLAVDAAAVRHRQDRRDPGQHQPGVPHPRAGVRARPGRGVAAGGRAQLQELGLRRDDRGGPRRPPGPAARRDHRLRRVDGPVRPLRRRRPRARGAGGADPGRPDQHPVHVRDDGLPQGRDALAPQHPQQRLLRRAADRLLRRRPRLHPGALLPLLRHGHGQPRLHQLRGDDGHPGARLRPHAHARGGRAGALHLALRRADDVHRRAGPGGLRVLRPHQPAHRDHGRLAVPHRGDEAGRRADGHERGRDLLRDDRDQPRLDPDPHRRLAGPPGVDGRAHHAPPRVEDRRPGDRAHRAPRGARASCAPAGTR